MTKEKLTLRQILKIDYKIRGEEDVYIIDRCTCEMGYMTNLIMLEEFKDEILDSKIISYGNGNVQVDYKIDDDCKDEDYSPYNFGKYRINIK